jgi:hypothetical protein
MLDKSTARPPPAAAWRPREGFDDSTELAECPELNRTVALHKKDLGEVVRTTTGTKTKSHRPIQPPANVLHDSPNEHL